MYYDLGLRIKHFGSVAGYFHFKSEKIETNFVVLKDSFRLIVRLVLHPTHPKIVLKFFARPFFSWGCMNERIFSFNYRKLSPLRPLRGLITLKGL